MLIIEEN